jgi:hypothetical protein
LKRARPHGTGSHGRDDAEIATATVFAELELSLLLETNVYRAENIRSTLFNISISVKIPGLVKIFFTFLRAFRLPPSAFRLPPSAFRLARPSGFGEGGLALD